MNYSEIFEDSSIPFDRVKTKSGQNEKGMLLSFAGVKKNISSRYWILLAKTWWVGNRQ